MQILWLTCSTSGESSGYDSSGNRAFFTGEITLRYACSLYFKCGSKREIPWQSYKFQCLQTWRSFFLVDFQDLSRLGRDLSQVVIVDNSPASYIFHPDNAVSALPSSERTMHLLRSMCIWTKQTEFIHNFSAWQKVDIGINCFIAENIFLMNHV